MPGGRMMAMEASATLNVECAAVARSAGSHLECVEPAAPQLTTMR